jgi:hypothetical protein
MWSSVGWLSASKTRHRPRAGDVLRGAVAAGVNVMVDGDAAIEPPAAIIDARKRHKVEIIALLTAAEAPPNRQVIESVPTSANGADRDDTDWEERAAVMEYDGDIPRRWAEAQARLTSRQPVDVRNASGTSCAMISAGSSIDGRMMRIRWVGVPPTSWVGTRRDPICRRKACRTHLEIRRGRRGRDDARRRRNDAGQILEMSAALTERPERSQRRPTRAAAVELTDANIQRAVFAHLRIRGAPGIFSFHPKTHRRTWPAQAGPPRRLAVEPGVPDVIVLQSAATGTRVFALKLRYHAVKDATRETRGHRFVSAAMMATVEVESRVAAPGRSISATPEAPAPRIEEGARQPRRRFRARLAGGCRIAARQHHPVGIELELRRFACRQQASRQVRSVALAG